MAKHSAGLLLYRQKRGQTEIFLVHPGGPFWARKDEGSWSIPKGELEESEDPLEAAQREFREETGSSVTGEFLRLASVRQPSGKIVHAWAVEGDFDPATIQSNTFSMEWPRASGKMANFPEVDRAEWFSFERASRQILKGQRPFLDQLQQLLRKDGT